MILFKNIYIVMYTLLLKHIWYCVHCTVTLYVVQWTLHRVQCTLYGVQCVLYGVHCTVYIIYSCMRRAHENVHCRVQCNEAWWRGGAWWVMGGVTRVMGRVCNKFPAINTGRLLYFEAKWVYHSLGCDCFSMYYIFQKQNSHIYIQYVWCG